MPVQEMQQKTSEDAEKERVSPEPFVVPSTAGASNALEEIVWQWCDDDKKNWWKNCDADWHSVMNDNLRDDQLQFEITRRSGNDRYWIDLKKMVQTNANKNEEADLADYGKFSCESSSAKTAGLANRMMPARRIGKCAWTVAGT